MRDLEQALADLNTIRTQVARDTQFRGYGPGSTAVTGILAFVVAGGQSLWLVAHEGSAATFVGVWVITAVVAASISVCETFFRTRRMHAGFSAKMLQAAMEHFLPAVTVGLMLTVIVERAAPQESWMLPGLWQLAFCLGVFASCGFLPRPMFVAGLWYMVTGLASLAGGAAGHALSPWSMGVPFGVGQLLIAAILEYGYEDRRRLGIKD